MPYVPSHKTNPPAEDRAILDPIVRQLANETAEEITDNSKLLGVYQEKFLHLATLLRGRLFEEQSAVNHGTVGELAEAIYQLDRKYGYYGAYEGELNYSVTMFIQWVPERKVALGEWKESDELRYWLYGATVKALTWVAHKTIDWNDAISGVFEDIKDEYKNEVNRPYETAQMLKSGHCYFTPWYCRIIELVDEEGNYVGHQEVHLKRSEETLHVDLLPWQIVVRRRPTKKAAESREKGANKRSRK